jgi:hypothetical protein
MAEAEPLVERLAVLEGEQLLLPVEQQVPMGSLLPHQTHY